jgi:hypothetical protein
MDILQKPLAPIKVDCHIHLFPDRLFRAIREWFAKVGWAIKYPYNRHEVLSILKSFGIEQVWALTYAHKPGVADGINAWLGAVKREEPMVKGFFSVHPEDVAPEEIARRAMDEHGLDGLKLHAEVQNLSVDDRRLDRVFDLLEERKKPCVLHSGDAPYPFTKSNLDVGRVEERLRRNPTLIAVIAHLGANQTERYLALTERYPHLYLEVSFTHFPGLESKKPIDYESLTPYSSRLLYGSDFPNITFTYAGQADAWWALEWVRKDAESFFGGRARQILP